MKVIHLACVAPPEIGGMGSVSYREVALLRARGVDARLVAPEMSTAIPSHAERSFVDRAPTAIRIGNAAVLRHGRACVRDADLIHLHYPFYGTAEPLLLSRKKTDTPIVVSCHMDAMAGGIKGLIFAFHRLLLQNTLLTHASRVIVSSLDYALHSSLSGFMEDHASRVIELPFGVDTTAFMAGPSEKLRFGIPDNAPTVGFVGGLDRAHAFKGLEVLITILSRLGTDAHLLVIGDGDRKKQFEDQARMLGVDRRVHFAGRIPSEILPSAYRSMDVFAFPSTNTAEAFGLAALEAEACGVPVVASDLPGVRTVVRDGRTGWLVPPGNADALGAALLTLLADPVRRATMGQEAHAHALRYGWDDHIEQLLRIYADVCASPS